MIIYNYNPTTKEYIGQGTAQKDPKNPGNYLMPANATTIQVPLCTENETQIFNNDVWEIVKDYRGKEVISLVDYQISVVDYLGEIKENYQLVSNESLTEIKSSPEYQQYQAEENRKWWSDNFLQTSKGYLRINTAMGDILNRLNSYEIIARITQKLDANSLLFYSNPDYTQEFGEEYLQTLQLWNEELNYMEFIALFEEVAGAYLDKFKGISND
jgi:hypothetical protein